jgi:hypothetical protein
MEQNGPSLLMEANWNHVLLKGGQASQFPGSVARRNEQTTKRFTVKDSKSLPTTFATKREAAPATTTGWEEHE